MTSSANKPWQSRTTHASCAGTPPYAQVKQYVRAGILDGVWRSGDRIPAEVQLAKELNLARMTVSRALRELVDEGVLSRIPGSGTYVTPVHTDIVEIGPIVSDIRRRGRTHRAVVVALECVASDGMALIFTGSRHGPAREVLHSRTLHFDNDVPVQFEDRYVDRRVVPLYARQDFTQQTPDEYLRNAVSSRVSGLRIFAQRPDPVIRDHLQMELGEPCLVMYQETRAGDNLVSVETLWHPSSRFHLCGEWSK
jgi:GntR family histidine utilization transcriptional repressor